MFLFEKEVSRRLVTAARNHLPDQKHVPAILIFLEIPKNRLQSVVLAMVKRGDFNLAVRQLTDLLIKIGADYRFNFQDASYPEVRYAIDSLIVVIVALLAAFTQQMIELKLVSPSAVNMLEPFSYPMCCLYAWRSVTRVPPLERSVAADLLSFVTRVIPGNFAMAKLLTPEATDPRAKFADTLFSLSEYVYMANPAVVQQAMGSALAEWDPPAVVELAILSPVDSDALEFYINLIKSYLPRLDSNDQQKLLRMMCLSMLRGMIQRPSLTWAMSPGANTALKSLGTVIEKSRLFRTLRVFRRDEALAITITEILQKAETIHHHTNPQSGSSSMPASPQNAVSSFLRKGFPSPETKHQPLSPTSSSSMTMDHDAKYFHHKVELMSIAHTKTFERAVSLAKRENPTDKRAASRLASIEYFVFIAFIGWAVSQVPGGEPLLGIALDIRPLVSLIIEDFQNISPSMQIRFAVVCSQLYPFEFEKLLPNLSPRLIFDMLQLLRTSAKPERFSKTLVKNSKYFIDFLLASLHSNDPYATCTALNLLKSVDSSLLSASVVLDVLSHLTTYMSKKTYIDPNLLSILESYVLLLVNKIDTADLNVHVLEPLILPESPTEVLHNPQTLQGFYHFLRILSRNHVLVPDSYFEPGGILALRSQRLRAVLLIILCSDSNEVVDLALKCIELLQSDPNQSRSERDLVSELLDSMDQPLSAAKGMQKRMATLLSSEPDTSFTVFNELVRNTLRISKEKPLSDKFQINLLRMRTATLILESEEVRSQFYTEFLRLDGDIIRAVSGSLPLSTKLAGEFIHAIHKKHDVLTSIATVPISPSQLAGKCQLYTWLLDCLASDFSMTASELRLGEICSRAVMSLPDDATLIHELSVLKLLETSAKYAMKEKNSLSSSVLFGQVVKLVMARSWSKEAVAPMGSALVALFSNYVVEDEDEMKSLLDEIADLNEDQVQISALAAFFNANYHSIVKRCQGSSLEVRDSFRASMYETLTKKFSAESSDNDKIVKSGDFVVFLLENKPVITALSDVCSLNGDDGLAPALVQLFLSHSQDAERNLIKLAVTHEADTSSSPSDVFRGNTINMKVLLEWLRTVSAAYLRGLLLPALGSLRSASIRDVADMESRFAEAAARFRHRNIPIYLRWLISLVMEAVTPRYGKEVAKHSLAVLLVLRFICPAVLAPHAYGISRPPPARQFANILRQFAIYLQRHGDLVYEYMTYNEENSLDNDSIGSDSSKCENSEDFEKIFVEMDGDIKSNKSEFNEQYMSSSRRVYHFLRRHAVEVRVVLLSQGHGEIVAKMLRFFRLGRISDEKSSNYHRTPRLLKEYGLFQNKRVIAVSARALYSKFGGVTKDLVRSFGSQRLPTVIDFTDFTGLFDFWAEFMTYVAYAVVKPFPRTYTFYAVNCPRRAKSVILRVHDLIVKSATVHFKTSLDFVDSESDLPKNLRDAKSAVVDIKDAVKFGAQVRAGTTNTFYEAEIFIGSRYIQIIGKDNECDVIPYVPALGTGHTLSIKLIPGELKISLEGYELTIYKPHNALIRVLGLCLVASGAVNEGAKIDLEPIFSLGDLHSTPSTDSDANDRSIHRENTMRVENVDLDHLLRQHQKHDVNAPIPDYGKDIHNDAICPGRLLYHALLDSMHESLEVRMRALELYTLLPTAFGLQLSVPSTQQALMPNQVFALAATAAKRHPELSLCIVSSLALEGTQITEKAAKLAAPWVQYLDYRIPSHRIMLRSNVIEPLLRAVSEAPRTVGPALLEHFWPFLRGMPKLMADILLDISLNASSDSLDALRQILTSGISPERPQEAREFAEALLAKIYSSLRGTGNPTATLWSQHPNWKEINVCAILFGSITVDWNTAEELIPDVTFLLLILVGVGAPQLRHALYQLLSNYVNAFMQSPKVLPAQRHRLNYVRSELNGPRGLALFGVMPENTDEMSVWVSDDFMEYAPEMSEHLGWLVSDILTAQFADRLSLHQDTRVAIASRVMEHTDITWPPLQRRCILGLIGTVRFLMPESIVTELLNQLGKALAETREGTLATRGVIVSAFLRMFAETLECIPDTGKYQQYLFWLAAIALGTGCVTIQLDAMRLLRESIKIAHFRGMFKQQAVSKVYLDAIPHWLHYEGGARGSTLPLDLPTTESNFHIALAQLLATSLQRTESQTMAIECCDVLATACPKEFVYPVLLYLSGNESRIAARVPTGALADGNNAVAHWLASMVKYDKPSTVMALALCAEISGFSRSTNFSQTGPRLMELVCAVKDRRVVNLVSPLLRRIFLKLLELGERNLELDIALWSMSIFSHTPEERRTISNNSEALLNMIQSLGMRPWFDSKYQLQPLFYEEEFTETTRVALEDRRWIIDSDSIKNVSGQQSEKLF